MVATISENEESHSSGEKVVPAITSTGVTKARRKFVVTPVRESTVDEGVEDLNDSGGTDQLGSRRSSQSSQEVPEGMAGIKSGEKPTEVTAVEPPGETSKKAGKQGEAALKDTSVEGKGKEPAKEAAGKPVVKDAAKSVFKDAVREGSVVKEEKATGKEGSVPREVRPGDGTQGKPAGDTGQNEGASTVPAKEAGLKEGLSRESSLSRAGTLSKDNSITSEKGRDDEPMRSRSQSHSRQTSMEPSEPRGEPPGDVSGTPSQENTVTRRPQPHEQMDFENLKQKLVQLSGRRKAEGGEVKGQPLGVLLPTSAPSTPHAPVAGEPTGQPSAQLPTIPTTSGQDKPALSTQSIAPSERLPPPATLTHSLSNQNVSQVGTPAQSVASVPAHSQPHSHHGQHMANLPSSGMAAPGMQPGLAHALAGMGGVMQPQGLNPAMMANNPGLLPTAHQQMMHPMMLLQALQQPGMPPSSMPQPGLQASLAAMGQPGMSMGHMPPALAHMQPGASFGSLPAGAVSPVPSLSALSGVMLPGQASYLGLQETALMQQLQQLQQAQATAHMLQQSLAAHGQPQAPQPGMSPQKRVDSHSDLYMGVGGWLHPGGLTPQQASLLLATQQSPPHHGPSHLGTQAATKTTTAGTTGEGHSKHKRVDRPPDLANLEQALIEKLHGPPRGKGHLHMPPQLGLATPSPMVQYMAHPGQEMPSLPGSPANPLMAAQQPQFATGGPHLPPTGTMPVATVTTTVARSTSKNCLGDTSGPLPTGTQSATAIAVSSSVAPPTTNAIPTPAQSKTGSEKSHQPPTRAKSRFSVTIVQESTPLPKSSEEKEKKPDPPPSMDSKAKSSEPTAPALSTPSTSRKGRFQVTKVSDTRPPRQDSVDPEVETYSSKPKDSSPPVTTPSKPPAPSNKDSKPTIATPEASRQPVLSIQSATPEDEVAKSLATSSVEVPPLVPSEVLPGSEPSTPVKMRRKVAAICSPLKGDVTSPGQPTSTPSHVSASQPGPTVASLPPASSQALPVQTAVGPVEPMPPSTAVPSSLHGTVPMMGRLTKDPLPLTSDVDTQATPSITTAAGRTHSLAVSSMSSTQTLPTGLPLPAGSQYATEPHVSMLRRPRAASVFVPPDEGLRSESGHHSGGATPPHSRLGMATCTLAPPKSEARRRSVPALHMQSYASGPGSLPTSNSDTPPEWQSLTEVSVPQAPQLTAAGCRWPV